MATANDDDLYDIIKSLGLANKRVKTLKRFSHEYLTENWKTAKQLHGCGKYADDAWRIFCKGDWRDVDPSDHALNKYHDWLKEENKQTLNN
jgi:methyl-CpG-binding domain protein 4